MNDVEKRIHKVIKEVSSEEPWPGYYLIRWLEFKNLFVLERIKNRGRVLEIGCGNGFFSYLLSFASGKVVASDLYAKNSRTHTPGINNACRFISKSEKGNIFLCACAMNQLPFKDETFDMIFSGYTLQYTKDRTLALSEMRRVVKKDGVVMLVVPNFIERFYSFFQFYIYFIVKITKSIFKRIFKIKNKTTLKSESQPFNTARFRENYRYFPFPGPHGAYRNSFEEMIRHMPCNWNREFKKAGFKVVDSLTTAFLPYPLLLTISTRLTCKFLFLTKRFTRFFGRKPFIKYLGYNYCAVLKK